MSSDSAFIVGCGRSGTTLLYELMALHHSVAWVSTWSERTCRPELTALNGLYRASRSGEASRRGAPRPSEGYRVWDQVLPGRPESEGVLSAGAVDDDSRYRARKMAATYRRWGRAPVFLNKNTRNSRRLKWLTAAFPEALFISVVRHPLDTVSSLLAVPWWPQLPLWTEAGQTPEGRDRQTQVVWAARLWDAEATCVLEAQNDYPDQRFVTIRYEDLVADPAQTLEGVLGLLGLEQTRQTSSGLAKLRLRHSVGAHATRLTPQEHSDAWAHLHERARLLGYV